MWAEILMMFAELPGEHTKQEAEYRAKMQCLRENRCYTVLDTRDNTWIIREKSPSTILEENKCSTSSDCKQLQPEPIKNSSD